MLQTSLLHYEYILSHCQPAYMAHLQVTFAIARSGTSDLILALSIVGIGILPLQLLTSRCLPLRIPSQSNRVFCLGLFGMNATVPHDGDDDHLRPDGTPAGFIWFGIVLALAVLILIGYACLVKFWRKQAREKGRIGKSESVKQSNSLGIASAFRKQWDSMAIRFRRGV